MFVPTIIVETVVPTMIVGTAVPTIIVLTAYYWKSRVTNTLSSTLWGISDTGAYSAPGWEFQTPLIIGEIVGDDGYLMALPLPRTHWDKSAWWTTQGWTWIQH